MALTPEGKVKAQVVKLLRRLGVYYFFPATHGFGRSGVPDVICCVPPMGLFFAIECKAGKNKPTKLQEHEIEQIRRSGGRVLVVNEENVDGLESFIHQMIVGV